ncbi:YncE family protein [Mycobacterium asiaticum]|uniref:YncE family protein n=1 Tax=Mycobacterium asiaticum TaxID=1790 RepID=A0A1A3N6Q5_MYCAS|nr:YncE family protein [Mycobacterium asiaticum]OBK17476.1 hypothetical protein A5636_22685 [Mycobacterium asiaticum]
MSLVHDVNGREPNVLEHAVAVQITVGKGAISGIAAARDGRRLLVTNYGGDSVSLIDTRTCREIETIAGLDEPFAIGIDETANRAYVTTVTPAYDVIQVVDLTTNSVVGSHAVALSISDLTVSADGKHVYASRNGAHGADLAVMDTATERFEVIGIANTPGTTTECVRVSPDGGRVYVGVNGPAGGQLVVIETGKSSETTSDRAERARWRRKVRQPAVPQHTTPRIISTIDVGTAVRDVAISPNGGLVYVASSGPDFAVLDVVDTRTNKITNTRKIGEITGVLTRLTIGADGRRAYLVSDDSVTMLCTLTQDVIDSVNVGTQPSCVVESSDGRYLYIADYSGAVTMAPIAEDTETGFEQIALESKRPADLIVPDMLQYDAALV